MRPLLILAAAAGLAAWWLGRAQRDARCIHAARQQARDVRRRDVRPEDIALLLERSSLGDPVVRSIRARTSARARDRIRRRSGQLEDGDR